jgi:hypothetical protein
MTYLTEKVNVLVALSGQEITEAFAHSFIAEITKIGEEVGEFRAALALDHKLAEESRLHIKPDEKGDGIGCWPLTLNHAALDALDDGITSTWPTLRIVTNDEGGHTND